MMELGMVTFWFITMYLACIKGLLLHDVADDGSTDAWQNKLVVTQIDSGQLGFERYLAKMLLAVGFFVQPCIILPILMGQRSRSALRSLRDFSFAEAQCYSAEDREALTAVICSWYTDHQAGETDPDRLQQLGMHKFETFVRHDLAPAIERQEAGEAKRVGFVCALISIMTLLLTANTAIGSGSTVTHLAFTLTYLMAMLNFICPTVVLWYQVVTSATGRFIEDVIPRLSSPRTAMRRVLTTAAYIVCLLTTAASLPFCSVLLGAIRVHKYIAPDWRIPEDDGLDPETRRFAKHYMAVAFYMLGIRIPA